MNPTNSTLGKSEAREQFLPLISAIAAGAGPFNITDHGKPVAVLISKQEYDWMLTQTKNKSQHKPKSKNPLIGSIIKLDDLEEGSREIAKLFQESIEKTAREL